MRYPKVSIRRQRADGPEGDAMDGQDSEDRRVALAARAPRHGLIAATIAFCVIGLAGPLMLASGIDPRPYGWLIAPLWLVVIGGGLIWVRAFLGRLEGAKQARAAREDPTPGQH